MDLALNNLQRLICYKTQATNEPAECIGRSKNACYIWNRHLYGESKIKQVAMVALSSKWLTIFQVWLVTVMGLNDIVWDWKSLLR